MQSPELTEIQQNLLRGFELQPDANTKAQWLIRYAQTASGNSGPISQSSALSSAKNHLLQLCNDKLISQELYLDISEALESTKNP